jgi:hypothetical protein
MDWTSLKVRERMTTKGKTYDFSNIVDASPWLPELASAVEGV